MTKILKGDTSNLISLVLAEGFDYTGATVEVRYQGAVRKFTGVTAGETIAFQFQADETAPMSLGVFPVTVRIATADGGFFTVNNGGVVIAVTDDPAEVWVDGVIAVDAHGMLHGITDLPEHYTDQDVVAKVREILRKGGALLCLALCACSLFGAGVTTKQKQNIYNDEEIVTGVDFSGLAHKTDIANLSNRVEQLTGGAVTQSDVTNIVNNLGENFGKVKSVNGQTGDVEIDTIPSDYATVRSKANAAASKEELAPVQAKADDALLYSSGVYQYMIGNTNAWFSGTNYVVTADGTTRTRFAWEDGMDAGTVPCSMALWENRDGQKCVWDQRDWTVWYWNFKSTQLSNNLARVIGNIAEEVNTNCMKRGWAKYTAVRGLDNPDPSTLWIDTPKVQLMAGHQWEKIVEVGGAGYYTLTGNGIQLAPADAENTFLTIKDFEGNACLTFRKTSSYLVYCECGTDIVSNSTDSQGRAVFHLTTDVQPTAEFSTVLELDSFVEQDGDGCPANYEWTGSAGSWDCHFKLKTGIVSNACFARFKVMREGENVVEHTVPIKLNGGIVFEQNGQTLKCKPVAQDTSVGSTVNWVIAQ